MNVAQMFPLLTVGLIIYGVLTLANFTVGPNNEIWHMVLVVELPLPSDEVWSIRGGDIFLLGSMGLLFVELIRATKTDTNSLTNHALSFILFIIALMVFIFVPGFGNSTFFLFLAMTFLDPMAGIIVTTVTARRDLAVTDGIK
ncbi:MAG: hypothetical protein AAFR21_09635 [Pseudomonadota bacterium]